MRKIITTTGEIVPLAEWQVRKGYQEWELGKHFSTRENKLNNPSWVLHELLFVVLDELRIRAKRAIRINSAYRTDAEQRELLKVNEGAATFSPHPYGLAIDIDTVSNSHTALYVALLRKISKDLNIAIRIGWRQYQTQKKPQTFIHIDVCPEMYGVDKPWAFIPNIPNVFKNSIEW